MATNYVLVDFENVQPDLSLLAHTTFKVKVFFGAKQQEGRVPFKLLDAMLALGGNVEPIKVMRTGKNAVDMHIAYYIGRLLEKEGSASVYVVSRDTDFDPLMEYLQSKGFTCRRVRAISEVIKLVPRAVVSPPKSASRATPPSPAKKAQSDRLAPIIKHLHSLRGKPATRKALAQTVNNYFHQHGGALPDKLVDQLIGELIRLKYVSQAGQKVSYHLS